MADNTRAYYDYIKATVDEIFSKIAGASALREDNKANIVIAGKSGAGKSTLINSVFRENLADTGVGTPVTQGIKALTKKGVPLKLYDTPGFELSPEKQRQLTWGIQDLIERGRTNPKEAIHIIWYCIATPSNRVEEAELNFIRELAEPSEYTGVPSLMVLTQSYDTEKANELKNTIEKRRLKISGVFPLLASGYKLGNHTFESYGLETLVRETVRILPDSVRDSFINAQKADLKMKEERARKYVNGYAATAFTTGFTPLPFADAPILMAEQVVMIGNITSIFGLNLNKEVITAIVTALLGPASASVAGKTIVSNLLKLIPGVGTVIGGFVSGSTAAAITKGLGELYISILMGIMSERTGKIPTADDILKYARLRGN